ncbi:hypothetical protein DF044_05130 [Burkholderia contaminans]|uniref:Uncharacterized protein n=1 Tax=Burkholderia contaminans TaxID=488447 RepID=A0A3N8Q2J3_9BURK|nr:hypothetical protein DF035_04675 [Burkholderia contaminans]RQT17390.1 hypothetical protein DF044_05130 [Burkholderia contaminans]RQT36053.1 hypothetical protein DF037_03225 [Burkholderia contaminans]RQT37697.1 hypothetical protein DF036_09140 [Burkholderia contaminans]TCW72915.1 hypothetical protein C5O79_03005 [Burkholderia sp. SRS-25]
MVAVSDGVHVQRNTCHRAGTVVETTIRAQALRIVSENGRKCFRPETRGLGNTADSIDTLQGRKSSQVLMTERIAAPGLCADD